MSFHNPYMKTPDWGQGMQDIGQQIMLMRLMQQLMGGGDQQTQTPDTSPQGMPPPMSNIQPQQGIGQDVLGGAQGQLGQQQMDPQMLMMIMQLLQGRQQ